jgi:hypothetical protein
VNVYDWPNFRNKLTSDILSELPLASMSTEQIQRVKELLVRVDNELGQPQAVNGGIANDDRRTG